MVVAASRDALLVRRVHGLSRWLRLFKQRLQRWCVVVDIHCVRFYYVCVLGVVVVGRERHVRGTQARHCQA